VTLSAPCSALAAHEPLPGTAPRARGWLVLEHPGPYGRVATDALGDVADPLRDRCRDAGITLLLARRPRVTGRRAWLAIDGRMLEWNDVDPAMFLQLDLATIATGVAPPASEPLLFVCTNGKRDACCAQFGRPVADALMHDDPAVLECSHIGGHRLAPTALELPSGAVHGRLTIDSARAVLAHAREGRLHLATLRGLSHLSPPEQVADIAVRRAAGVTEAIHLDVRCAGDDAMSECVVTHPDGRSWLVLLARHRGTERPESCGKDPLQAEWWAAEQVEPR